MMGVGTSSTGATATGYEYDDAMGHMRAAAMAEKEASRILLLERERLSPSRVD